jgi:hypothetical protein
MQVLTNTVAWGRYVADYATAIRHAHVRVSKDVAIGCFRTFDIVPLPSANRPLFTCLR